MRIGLRQERHKEESSMCTLEISLAQLLRLTNSPSSSATTTSGDLAS
jgi:hypothetical protein